MTDQPIRTITIDPPNSRDHDDAVWLDGDLLTVWVPDVAAAILPDSDIDQIARERGFSRCYGACGAEHMLPTVLAERDLSLHAGERRRAIAIEMDLDDALDVRHVRLRRSELTVGACLTYTDVPEILRDPNHPRASLAPVLTRLTGIANHLAAKRRKRGELAFVNVRSGWASGEEGQIRRLAGHEMNIGFVIIQELMILTNRTLATLCVREDAPVLYRNHRLSIAAPSHVDLLAELELALSHPEQFEVATTAQRMALLTLRARYGPRAEGHFGLNLPCYGHFTSPLRRYADLVNGRALAELADAKQEGRSIRPPYSDADLESIGDHLHELSQREQARRDDAERARAQRKAVAHLEHSPTERLADLSPSDAFQVMRAASVTADAPEVLAAALSARMRRNSVTLKELFHLLYQIKHADDSWTGMREEALAYVQANPNVAVSLLSMGQAVAGWSATHYRIQPVGAGFACVARHVGGARTSDTPEYCANGKKEAKQVAAAALCFMLAGFPPPTPDRGRSGLEDIINTTEPDAAARVAGTNVVDALIRVCTNANRRKPRFNFRFVRQEDGKMAWECDASVDLGSGLRARVEVAPMKQAAKNAASIGLLRDLVESVALPGTDTSNAVRASPECDANAAPARAPR